MALYWLSKDSLDALLQALQHRGYQVMGPVLREGIPTLGPVERAADLPWGVEAETAPGRYRTRSVSSSQAFDYVLTPQGWKRILFPPERWLLHLRKTDLGYEVWEPNQEADPPLALLGVRPCELAALKILDRVLIQGPFVDHAYAERRRRALVIVVNCSRSLDTCFCASLGTGPRAEDGYDLALTELPEGFVVETGSFRGAELLQDLALPQATDIQARRAQEAVAQAAQTQSRHLNPEGLRDLLYDALESSVWQEIGEQCLGCGNCTLVCPTCFCTRVDEITDLTGKEAWRLQSWDTCFSVEYAYLHGGSIRRSVAARYRQWLTHKLAGWQDQFGTLGCVGCGRCITWCPVGIDLTQQVHRLRQIHPRPAGVSQEEAS